VHDSAYRVILTGELLPGFERESAVHGMARLFDQPPEVLRRSLELGNAPVNQLFSAEEAFHAQNRLERLGVRSRIERVNHRQAALRGSDPGALEPGKMKCPACGQIQMVSTTCAACGINFEDYNRQRREGRLPATPPARSAVQTANGRHTSSWQQAAAEFEDEIEPGEEDYLALFVGPRHITNYLPAFARYRDGGRLKFAIGWNWGAVFSPFLWAMQRKLWFWALIMLLTEIVVPTTLIVLGTRPGVPLQLALIGGLLLVVNRMVWPALANYLYYRHARASIRRLERMSVTMVHENAIVEAGGVSYAGAFVGLCMAVVSVLFCWNLIDSLGIGKTAFERGEYYAPRPPREALRQPSRLRPRAAPPQRPTRPVDPPRRSGAVRASAPPGGAAPAPGDHGSSAAAAPDGSGSSGLGVGKQNKWVATRSKLRSLGLSINEWLGEAGPAGVDPTSLTVLKLRQQLALGEDGLADAWGSEIQYIPSDKGYRLISAGPDQLFGTADDLRYAKELSP
jgi:hypothetical protein